MKLLVSVFTIALFAYIGSIKSIPTLHKKNFGAKHFINLQHYRPNYMLWQWDHRPVNHDMRYWASKPSECICYPSSEDLDKCYKKAIMIETLYYNLYKHTVNTVLEWCEQDVSYFTMNRYVALKSIKDDYDEYSGWSPLGSWELRRIHWAMIVCSFPCLCE